MNNYKKMNLIGCLLLFSKKGHNLERLKFKSYQLIRLEKAFEMLNLKHAGDDQNSNLFIQK